MNKKYEIFWNNIELLFSSPNKDEWDINEDFNYHTKIFTVTRWVQDLFILDSEQEIKTQLILYYDKTNKDLNPSIKYENELKEVWSEIHNLTKWLSNAYEELYIETIDFKKVIKEKLVQDLEKKLENLNDRREELIIKLEKLDKTEKNKNNIKRVISKFNYNLNNKITDKEKVEIIKEFLDKIIIMGNWKIDISLKFFTWNDDKNWDNDDDWW